MNLTHDLEYNKAHPQLKQLIVNCGPAECAPASRWCVAHHPKFHTPPLLHALVPSQRLQIQRPPSARRRAHLNHPVRARSRR
jgi:hypothetical protein